MGVVVIGGGGSQGGGGGGQNRAVAYPTGEVVSIKGEIIGNFSSFGYAQMFADHWNSIPQNDADGLPAPVSFDPDDPRS